LNFEIIIYESGLIKLQYKDADTDYTSYTNGYYGLAGIEDPSGTIGLEYSDRMETNLYSGLAVMIGKDMLEVDSASVDTDAGGAAYAEYRDYELSAQVSSPVDNDQIRAVAVTLGNDLADMVMYYNSDGSYHFSESDPNGYVSLNVEDSYVVDNGDSLTANFKFSPSFAFPTNHFQDLTVQVIGVGALPGTRTIPDAFWVENKLDLAGSLLAYSENRGLIENGGWVHGSEEFQFRGLKAIYPGTVLSPRPGSHTFTATDEFGNEFIQTVVEGECEIDVIAENDLTKKTYNITITGIPEGSDISGGVSFIVSIDPFKPLPPTEIKIHADSFEDKNTEYDDDNEVFVTWEPAEDYESGILGYYVSTFNPQMVHTTEDALWVESPDTSTKMIFETMGTRKVYVWSVDKAGNPSIPGFSITKIDAEEVSFSEFSPGHEVWVNTHTPISSLLITDGDGSGVSAKDVQYSISTTTPNEYSAWATIKVAKDAPDVRASVKTTFINGKTNWIRYRAKDVAGNGWTYSQDYNVWVDEEAPSFINFRPYEAEYQNGRSVVISLDITDLHGAREGSGVKLDSIEYRYSVGGQSLYGDWNPVQIISTTEQSVHVEMELEFNEGKNNYVQFRAYDNVGNFAQSKDFNIRINSAPTIKAILSDPINGITYTTDEKILFDASGSQDPDGDDLDFLWYSDINGFLSGSESFFRSLSAGIHVITLIVNDPAHSSVVTFEITILEKEQIDPESIDTDGDGMYDEWEIENKLNPFRPDGFIDSDHDMFTNFQEYQNGTDPTLRTSHPPYPTGGIGSREASGDDDIAEQYFTITLALVLLSLVVIIALILLAYSKRRDILLEMEDEKELEAEEQDYTNTLQRKKAERLGIDK
jgi:hypothetical protein